MRQALESHNAISVLDAALLEHSPIAMRKLCLLSRHSLVDWTPAYERVGPLRLVQLTSKYFTDTKTVYI